VDVRTPVVGVPVPSLTDRVTDGITLRGRPHAGGDAASCYPHRRRLRTAGVALTADAPQPARQLSFTLALLRDALNLRGGVLVAPWPRRWFAHCEPLSTQHWA
jgi:hypothetical protein